MSWHTYNIIDPLCGEPYSHPPVTHQWIPLTKGQ